MQTIKLNKRNSFIIIALLCVICLLAASIPFFTHAGSETEEIWDTFVLSDRKANEARTELLVISDDGESKVFDFYGHFTNAPCDYALTYPENSKKDQAVSISYTIDSSQQKPHSCDGYGFLFNVGSGGYYAMVRDSNVYLMYLKNLPNERLGLYQPGRMINLSCDGLFFDLIKDCTAYAAPYNSPTHYFAYPQTFDPFNSSITAPGNLGYQTNTNWYSYNGHTTPHNGFFDVEYTGTDELIKTASVGYSSLYKVNITATSDHVTMVVNGKTVLDTDLPYKTNGHGYGPAVQYAYHNCSDESHVKFSQVITKANIMPPIADFNYNTPIADIRQPVFVTDASKDGNTPASPLTYYWTVEKQLPDGTKTTVYPTSSTIPTGYNSWGSGKYITTLKVKNEYELSDEVSKVVEIIQNPQITIQADKSEYYPGDRVTFKCNKWYNCNTSPSDVTITNVVSDKLYNPSVFLVGSNGMTSVSGNLSASVEFKYKDGTASSQPATIPPNGLLVQDPINKDKEVNKITIVYNQLSHLADLKPDSYVLYSYDTSKDLSVYYVGGVAPRKYEISNSATITVRIATGPVSASSSAKTNLIEKRVSLSLSGMVDNNEAITDPPDCNTEFLFTGTSIGGETISKYIVVTKGESNSIEVPYGNYILSEEAIFALGYDAISPIEITIDDRGIVVDEKTTIESGGKIPFTKVLQTAKIDVSRIYKSEEGINIESDTDFKVMLIGTPVVRGIAATFELTSPKADSVYYWKDKSTLTLPIGSYMLKETQAYRLVSLEDISASGEVKWNRILNTNPASEKGKAAFIANNGEIIPVILRYVSDEYVYDEYVYENSIYFAVNTVNSEGAAVTDDNLNKVLVNPSTYKYPIRLINTETGEDYCGIIESNEGIAFKYMHPGEYEIICSNNMYMNYDKLREINSDSLDFFERNGKNYVGIPEDFASGEYKETSKLTNWRGYSEISSKSSVIQAETRTHVSLTLAAKDQEKTPITNCELRFMQGSDPIYFVKRFQKWYPAEKGTAGATSVLRTDKYGGIDIYKFPNGEYTIEQVSPLGSLDAVSLPQSIIVNGTRNIGVEITFTNKNKIDSPSFIALTALKDSIAINETLILSERISPATSSKNITYSSSNNDIANVSADGVITGKAVGKVTIKAVSDKDKTIIGEYEINVYDPNSPEITNLRQTISNIKLEVGESYKTSVTYSPSAAKAHQIIWTSSDTSVATVSSDGTITGVSVGTVDIIAKCGELTSVCRVTVGRTLIPVCGINLDKEYLTLIYNNNLLAQETLQATVSPDNASDKAIVFTSSSPNIVSVDMDGNLVAKALGTAVITASSTNGISQSCIVSSVPIVDKITLSTDSLTLVKGHTAKVLAKTSPNGSQNEDSLIWKSSNSSVAAIDSEGVITANQIGKAVISAIVSYPNTEDVVAECQINVVTEDVSATGLEIYIPVEGGADYKSLTEDLELELGGAAEFSAVIMPTTATTSEIDWSYSRSNLITINSIGSDSRNPMYRKYEIIANEDNIGETIVTGKIKGTDVTTQFKVIVNAPGTNVELTKQGTQTLFLDVVPELTVGVNWEHPLAEVKSINWTLSDDSKATLSISESNKEATITALEEGTVILTAEVEFKIGGTHSASVEVEIKEPIVEVLIDGAPQQTITRGNKPSYDIVLETDESINIIFKPNYPLDSKANYGFFSLLKGTTVTKNSSDDNILSYTITGGQPTCTQISSGGTRGNVIEFNRIGITIPGMYIRVWGRYADTGSVCQLSVSTYNCYLPGNDGHWVSEDENIIAICSERVSSSGENIAEIDPVSDGATIITYTCSSYTIRASLTVENGIIKFVESETIPLPKELVTNPHYWSERG